MKCNLMVIFDKGAQESAEPFLAKRGLTQEPYTVGKRKFTDTVNAKIRKLQGVELSDFELWNVAVYDTETMEIIPEKERVMSSADCPQYVDGDSLED